MPAFSDNPELLLRLTELLISIGVAIQAAETLTSYRLYAPGGLYDWSVLATNNKWMLFGNVGRTLSVLFDYRAFMPLVAIQLCAAIVSVSGLLPHLALLWISILLGVHMLLLLRNQYGLDGSDQMMQIVL